MNIALMRLKIKSCCVHLNKLTQLSITKAYLRRETVRTRENQIHNLYCQPPT